jgi:hypothetical protein
MKHHPGGVTGNISSDNQTIGAQWARDRLAALAAQPVLWPGDVEEMAQAARVLGVRVWLRRVDLASGEVSVRSVGV